MKTFLSLIIILIISVFTIRPLLSDGYFPMHDDTQPSRIYEMAQQLKEGQFPVRWVADLGYGYGYPLFNFYAPLPYYIGAVFNLSGFNPIDSAKIMMGIAMLFAGISMFFLARELGGYLLGLTASLLYQFAPYHALDLYVRGAVGELYAYAFLPVAALGAVLIFKSKYKKGIILYALGNFLVLTSHNILGMILLYFSFFILILFLFFYLIKKIPQKMFASLLAGLLLGIGLSSFFILPAYIEKDYTRVNSLTLGGSNFRDHFVYLRQLWDFPWGYGGSAPGLNDGMSFKIGKINILASLFASVIFISVALNSKKKKDNRLTVLFYGSVLLTLASVFLSLDISERLWELLPNFSYIQYPWRFLNFILLFLCMIIALGLSKSIRLLKLAILILSIAVMIATHFKYFNPQYIYPEDEQKYISKKSLNWDISKISDEYLPTAFIPPKSYGELIHQSAKIDITNLLGQSQNSSDREIANAISLLSFVLFILLIISFRKDIVPDNEV